MVVGWCVWIKWYSPGVLANLLYKLQDIFHTLPNSVWTTYHSFQLMKKCSENRFTNLRSMHHLQVNTGSGFQNIAFLGELLAVHCNPGFICVSVYNICIDRTVLLMCMSYFLLNSISSWCGTNPWMTYNAFQRSISSALAGQMSFLRWNVKSHNIKQQEAAAL